MRYHPDRTKDERDNEKFKSIAEAYQLLRQEEKKREKISEAEVATKYTEFWKKYDRKSPPSDEFHFGPNFSSFREEVGARVDETYEHNQEKGGSPMRVHMILYGGLGAITLWIILSTILK